MLASFRVTSSFFSSRGMEMKSEMFSNVHSLSSDFELVELRRSVRGAAAAAAAAVTVVEVAAAGYEPGGVGSDCGVA